MRAEHVGHVHVDDEGDPLRGPLNRLCVAVASCAVLVGAMPARSADPVRVVSLAPSVTEIVYAIGAGDRLVGVCGQCNYPDAVRGLPRVGGYLTPSVEEVIGAEPDLVVVVPSPANREAVRAIERAGLHVLVVRDRRLADLWESIGAIAKALGREEAGDRLVRDVKARLDEVRARVAGRPRARTLLVVGHRPLVVAGGETLQSELLDIAGATNVAADLGQAWPNLSLETVVDRAPDVVVDCAMGSEAGGKTLLADLATVPAVRDGRIVSVSPDLLFRAGPRVAEAAAALAAAIHPDAKPAQ